MFIQYLLIYAEQPNDPEIQHPARQHQWTMTHSFWAIMGGISVDTDPADKFVPRQCTLTPKGISLLLKHEPDLLPDISIVEIKDKSKGSSLSVSDKVLGLHPSYLVLSVMHYANVREFAC